MSCDRSSFCAALQPPVGAILGEGALGLDEAPALEHDVDVAHQLRGPEDVSRRDFVIGLVCVATLIVAVLVVLAWLFANAGSKAM